MNTEGSKFKTRGGIRMKNLKTISLVTQNILFILYIPLAVFS